MYNFFTKTKQDLYKVMKELEMNTKHLQLKAGHTLAVHTLGAGTPVLCLAGFGCDHYIFLDLANELKENFQFIMIDNRGMGGSSKDHKPFSINDLAMDALEVAELLQLNQYHIMGISMGGFIAQLMVKNLINSNKIQNALSLSLLCTLGLGSEFHPLAILTDEQLRKFYEAPPELAMPMAVALTAHPQAPKEIINRIIKARLDHRETLAQVILQRDAVVDFFEKEILNYDRFELPTLIMTGDDDRTVNPENAKILKDKIKHSKLTTVATADHYFFMEKPVQVATEIKSFLGDIK